MNNAISIARTLPTAAEVTDRLIQKYGPDYLWQVERLSQHIFRAFTTDGKILLATLLDDGDITVREANMN